MHHPSHSDNDHHQFHNQIKFIHSPAQPPIVCSPSLIRQPTTFESLTSTFQSLSLPTFPSPFRQSNTSISHNLPSDPSLCPQPSKLSTPPFQSQSSHNSSHRLPTPRPPHHSDRIVFSAWFQFNNRRHLLLVNPVGIALWDVEDLETLFLACWIRWDHLIFPTLPPHKISSSTNSLDYLNSPLTNDFLNNFEPVSAAILPSIAFPRQPILVTLFNSLLDHCSKLIVAAADSGHVLHCVELKGVATELRTNSKTIVVATKSPLALHLYSWKRSHDSIPLSLVKLTYSPILDLAPRPNTGEPVFHLGQTRLLAYASSKPPSEREPHVATGPGISFVSPSYGPRSPSIVESTCESREGEFGFNSSFFASRNSSPACNAGTSWRDSVAPNLGAIDETARKLGGGLLNGAKYLSSWGQNLLNHNMENIHSSHQAFHHSPRNDLGIAFSQSAPLPHNMSASHSSHREPHGSSHGNVHIIDLFSGNCSKKTHCHEHSTCHFKVSSDPLTFLSLNPSSNLLLTSSIEGHSFHIFELRPASRVGKSYMNSYLLGNTGSRRETTVWHRYKLTRGITSAKVVDVTWRWDSKIVSVLTEHGTNHLFAIHPAGGAAGVDAANVSRSSRAPADSLYSLFGSRIHNPCIPQSLSVTVSAFEKIKHKPQRHHSFHPQLEKTALTTTFDPAGYFDRLSNQPEQIGTTSHSHHSRLIFVQHRPEHLINNSREDQHRILLESHNRLPSVLLYDPSTNSLTLYKFETKKKLLNSVTTGVSSGLTKNSTSIKPSSDGSQHANPQAQSQVSSSPSGISQLMQQKTQAGPKVHDHNIHTHSTNVFVHSYALVVWSLGVDHDLTMINANRLYVSTSPKSPCKPNSDPELGLASHSSASGLNWTSFAELDTFSHSPRILPRSIYTSHQFDFYNFCHSKKSSCSSFPHPTYQPFDNNPDFLEQLTRADFDHVKKKKLVVKREVQIQPGDLSSQQDSSDLFALNTVEINDNFINPQFGGIRSQEINGSMPYNQMYAGPIRSAVEAVLDPTPASLKSPLNRFPEFPNGRITGRASHGAHQNPLISLQKSLASNVAPVVGVVNERVRKEFGKITSSATIGEVGRRRISGAAYWNGISDSLVQRLNRKLEIEDGSAYTGEGVTSVSFEDDQDEAIRIDRALFDHQGPSSSSMNSFTSTNSLAHPNSDELSLEFHSRYDHSITDEDLAEEESQRWDGWTFEDDLEIKTQPEPEARSSLPSKILRGGSLHQFGDAPMSPNENIGWTSPMIHSITINQTSALVTRLQDIESKKDLENDEQVDFPTDGKLSSPNPLSHLQVKENKADSDQNSGSQSSSALSTSTSASTSGEDSNSCKNIQVPQIDHSPKAASVQKSSRLSKTSKSNRAAQNLKKR